MFLSTRSAIGTISAVVLALAVCPVSAAETGRLLPADADLILTLRVREFLKDHEGTASIRGYLDQGRRAALKRLLGIDPAQDIDRVTVALKVGGRGPLVIVEGRFHQDRLRATVQQLAGKYGGSFQSARMGDRELWQVSHPAGRTHLLLLDPRTLAISNSRKVIDAVALSTGRKQGALSPAVRALVDRPSKQHVSLVLPRPDRLAAEALRLLQQGDAGEAKTGAGFGKWFAGQVPVLRQYAKGLAAASVGLSIGDSSLRLELDLQTKTPELAQQLRLLLTQGNFWGGLALKSAGHPLLRQLADIIGKERVRVEGKQLGVQVEVPYRFLEEVVRASWLANLLPDPSGHARATVLSPSDPARHLMEGVTRRITSIPLWGPHNPPVKGALEVVAVRDIAYRTDPQADPVRHRLDLFYPRGKKAFPVVVLVHGGGWMLGDNRACGLYSSVGHFLAGQGFGVVLPNYRLSPWVKHPQHVRDVARAVAWTHGHIGRFGGDPKQLFLLGHSAGGHLVSLLATDESYLRAEGLKGSDIKGVVSASGVYRVPTAPMRVRLGGSGPGAARIDQQWPLRGDPRLSLDFLLPSGEITVDIAAPAFGPDPRERAKASPVMHVRPGLPPFLLLISANDLPTLSETAGEFHRALLREGCAARLVKLDRRNHNSLIFSAITPEDPAARTILEFLRKK